MAFAKMEANLYVSCTEGNVSVIAKFWIEYTVTMKIIHEDDI